MKKNKLLVGLLAVASMTGLVGCGNTQNNNKTDDSSVVAKTIEERAIQQAWNQINASLVDEVKTDKSSRVVNLPSIVRVSLDGKIFNYTLDYIFSDKYQPEETKSFGGYVKPKYKAEDSADLIEPTRKVTFEAAIKTPDTKVDYLTYKGKAILKQDGIRVADKIYDFNVALVKQVKVAEIASQGIFKGTPIVTYAYYMGQHKYGFAADKDAGITLFKPDYSDNTIKNASFKNPVLVRVTGTKDIFSGLVQIKGAFIEKVEEKDVPENALPAKPEKLVVTTENIDAIEHKDEGRYLNIEGKVSDKKVINDDSGNPKYVDFYITLNDSEEPKSLFMHVEKKNGANIFNKFLNDDFADGKKVNVEGWLSCYKSKYQAFPTDYKTVK